MILGSWRQRAGRHKDTVREGCRSLLFLEKLEDRWLPAVTYHNGPLLANVGIEAVYLGSNWASDPTLSSLSGQLNSYLASIVNSPYLDQLGEYSTSQYDIDRGHFLDGQVDPVNLPAGTTVTDLQIQNELRSLIARGVLQRPDANRLLFVYTPPDVHVTSASSQSSLNGFLGYHTFFTDSTGTPVAYAVVVHQAGNAQLQGYSPFQQFTWASSHELAESITDPFNRGWYENDPQSAHYGDEIGDLCDSYSDILTLKGYTVQAEWSNSQFNATGNGHFLLQTPPLAATPIASVQGRSFNGLVATLIDLNPLASAGDFTATIDWGDGQTSPGTITSNGAGGFNVSGTNTYNSSGLLNFTVTISDGNSPPLQVASTASVSSPSTFVTGSIFVTGADAGGGPQVNVYDARTGQLVRGFYAYDSHFQGGVRAVAADINGDGIPDIIAAPGPGGGPDIRVFDGVSGALIREFMAYDPAFTGGVYVAAGDVNGDGFADIITGAGPGGGPHVKVFSGKDGALLYSFFAYNPAFAGGVRVAAGDVNGDGRAEIITGAGPGGGPHVEVFSGTDGTVLQSFMAFNSSFAGGVFVAAADINGTGRADVVTSEGVGGSPLVQVYSGSDGSILQSFYAYDPSSQGEIRVASVKMAGSASLIVTSMGPGNSPVIHAFDSQTLALIDNLYAYSPLFTEGVFVGGSI